MVVLKMTVIILQFKVQDTYMQFLYYTVTKNLSERRGAKSSEMSPVPMRSIGQTAKAHQHQQNRMSQVLQVPTVNLYPSRKKGLTKEHVTFSEYLQFTCLDRLSN